MNFSLLKKIGIVFSTALFFIVSPVFAASFSLGAPGTNFEVGKTFSVTVSAQTAGQVINAAAGSLTFPKDIVEVTSISKSGSIVSLWVQEPQFSNTMGMVSFEGIMLNPGFSGSGKILSVNFRVKNAGTGNFSFSQGSILANDGNGTNILKDLGTLRITTVAPTLQPVPQPVSATRPEPVVIPEQIVSGTPDVIEESIIFTPKEITIPRIREFNPIIKKGDVFTIQGITDYPNAKIIISWGEQGGAVQQMSVVTQADGSFTAFIPDLTKGVYQFWVQVATDAGTSPETSKNTFVVQSAQMITMGEHVLSMMTILLGIGAVMFLVAALLVQAWFTLVRIRRRVSKDVTAAERAVHHSINILQEEIREQILLLQITKRYRKLTLEEEQVLQSLIKNSSQVEQIILDHLEKIKKDI